MDISNLNNIKCDGKKPNCVHCQEAKLECEYTEYKKRGPHKGYVRLLEERLVQLERKLINTGQELPPPISPKNQLELDDFPSEDIVEHLIDLFFQHIDSVFPLVHRGKLRQEMTDGTVSKPLLWSVMAIAARFSDHPNIKTNPPYSAGEAFAKKAISLINSSLLEPTIPNLQFWGIMSCLEYGRASGTKAYVYAGIAVRICYEMGLHQEETLQKPIYKADGTLDSVAMAFRRRIFWSCFCIDRFASTSTNHPQGFDIAEYDARTATIEESQCLLDPAHTYTLDRVRITQDPLIGVIPYYLRIIERFGEVCRYMAKARAWPPIPEFNALHQSLMDWHRDLPVPFRYSQSLLQTYREQASQNYLNFWLCSHGMYCTGMLALHRGSLAYSHESVQESIEICKEHVGLATEIFRHLKDIVGCNILPYMGYCAYIFSTVLMTAAFSSDPVSYRKSSASLAILFDTINVLSPYWPMCERLAQATKDLIKTHNKLYDQPNKNLSDLSLNYFVPPQLYHPVDLDFNSSEFLYDAGLFGQIIFDNKLVSNYQQPNPPNLIYPTSYPSSSS